MDDDAASSSSGIICIIHSTDQFITRLENRRLLVDRFTLDPATNSDSDYYWTASPLSLSPRLPVIPAPAPFLRITTDNRPKDPSQGFLFGSHLKDCDVVLDQASLKQFALKVNFETGEILLKNHSRNGTIIRYPGQSANKYKLSTQKSLRGAQTIDVVLGLNRFIRISFPGQLSNGQVLSRASPNYHIQTSPEFRSFNSIDMNIEDHESTNFHPSFQSMGGGPHPRSVAPNIDMDLDFAPDSQIALNFSQNPGVYGSGPFQDLDGFWPEEIDASVSSFMSENPIGSSPLSRISAEPFQMQSTPLGVVEGQEGLHMVINGVQVLYRPALRQWDMLSITGASGRPGDQLRALKKKLARLGRTKRETWNGALRSWISLRDGILLIRAVGLEAQLAPLIAMLPESVPPNEENFLLRYQRGPLKNHITFQGQEVAYNPDAGTVKATDLVKIVKVTRRALFAYFTRHPNMKKEVVKGGAHSGTYILLDDVPTLCRAFNINMKVYYLLQKRLASCGRSSLTQLATNSTESLVSITDAMITGEPPPTNYSDTTNPSSPFYEDYFGPNAEFTYQENVNRKPAGDSSSRMVSRSDVPRKGISPIHANTVNHGSHASHASHGSYGSQASHASHGNNASHESGDLLTSHSSHASSSSHEFPSSFYKTRGSLVLDLDLEDFTLINDFDSFTR